MLQQALLHAGQPQRLAVVPLRLIVRAPQRVLALPRKPRALNSLALTLTHGCVCIQRCAVIALRLIMRAPQRVLALPRKPCALNSLALTLTHACVHVNCQAATCAWEAACMSHALPGEASTAMTDSAAAAALGIYSQHQLAGQLQWLHAHAPGTAARGSRTRPARTEPAAPNQAVRQLH